MKLIKFIFIILLITGSNSFANNNDDSFNKWILEFKKKALENDISEKTFDNVM